MKRVLRTVLTYSVIGFIAGGNLLLPLAARAAIISGFSDTMTRHQISVASDHTILFVTPTGVQTNTDTITVNFASAFSPTFVFGSVGFDDIDLALDTTGDTTDCSGPFTDKTLAAAAGAGVWGASIASNILTLTPPTDAALGEIPAGDCLQIQIGTNAGGTDQITNPSAAGSYTLSVAGAFGDTGIAFLAINDADQVTITATVADTGGSGGGGDPPPTPPPNISNIQVHSITETTATVTWVTDVASNSTVQYGTTVSYGSSASDGSSVFSHSVPLSGLTPGTLYHFRVRSTGAGGESVSGDNTFTTLDATPPVISNILVPSISGTTATITWDTDENATSRVDYGTSEPFSLFSENLTLTNSHSITLTGLTPNTSYQFRVSSTDASNNTAQSTLRSFQSSDTVPPTISSISATSITQSGATISWSTNELADSKVVYGTTVSYGSQVTSGSFVANHSLPLTLLASGTLYHYAVVSKDASGNSATSTDRTFTTLTDTTPPANVTGFTATPGDQVVNLSWTNPTDPDFAGVRVLRKTVSSPTGPTDGTTVFDALGTSVSDTGRINGVQYFYAAFARDSSGNFASGALANATPFDTVPPGSATGFSAVPGDGDIQLTWTNPTDSDFASVQIQRSTTSFPATVTSGTTVFAGTGTNFLNTGLTNGTTYFYTIFVFDTSGNVSSGAQASTTPAASGPICGNSVCEAGENSTNCAIDCPATDVCGDGTCGATEDNASCAADCPAPPVSVCGNSICEAGEDSANCAIDCPATPPVVCGDGVCEGSEDSSNCSVDCPAPPASVCGNGLCEASEDSSNCAVDCPVTPIPPSSSPIPFESIEPWVQRRTIRLTADASQRFHTLPERTITVVLDGQDIPSEIESVFIRFGSDEFIMRETSAGTGPTSYSAPSAWTALTDAFRIRPAHAQSANGDYEASVTIPASTGTVPTTITVNYTNGTSASIDFTFVIDGYGRTVENLDGTETPVPNADITLESQIGGEWVTWNATPFFQINPTQSGSDGSYGFMVPSGTYRLVAKKDGYRDITTAPISGTNVINQKLTFISRPQSITEVIVPGAPITENILNVARNLTEQTTYFTSIIRQEVIEDPRVKKATTSFIVPAAAVITTAVVVSSVQAISFLSYLYFLLTQPFLLIGRRKRKEFGTIFNSLSKIPIDLAIVRLFRKNGKLVRTIVTDKQGRYAFLADPGEYRIEVSKQEFIFPSEFMKGMKEGGKFLDIYHGETIVVGEQGAVITANIPMDPIEIVKSGRRLIIEKLLRRAQDFLGLFSVIITGIAYALYRLPWLLIIFVFQLGIYFVFRRISRPKRPKNWGIVYDDTNRKPIPYAVARIVETGYNKVLESQITDSKGRYNFLVGNNKYFVTIEKPGYQVGKTREIDLTREQKGQAVIAEDISLRKTSAEILKEAAEEGMTEEEKKAYELKIKENAARVSQPKFPTSTIGQAPQKKRGTEESDEDELKRLYMEKMGGQSPAPSDPATPTPAEPTPPRPQSSDGNGPEPEKK